MLDTSFWQIFGLQLKIYVCSHYEFLRENIKNLQGIVTLLVVCCIGNGGAQLQLKLYGLHSHYLLGPITLSLLYCFLNYWILGVQKRKTRLDIFVIQFQSTGVRFGNKELWFHSRYKQLLKKQSICFRNFLQTPKKLYRR